MKQSKPVAREIIFQGIFEIFIPNWILFVLVKLNESIVL